MQISFPMLVFYFNRHIPLHIPVMKSGLMVVLSISLSWFVYAVSVYATDVFPWDLKCFTAGSCLPCNHGFLLTSDSPCGTKFYRPSHALCILLFMGKVLPGHIRGHTLWARFFATPGWLRLRMTPTPDAPTRTADDLFCYFTKEMFPSFSKPLETLKSSQYIRFSSAFPMRSQR